LGDQVADEVGQKLSAETTGAGNPMSTPAPAGPASPPATSGETDSK
jgi:hypothetical protein